MENGKTKSNARDMVLSMLIRTLDQGVFSHLVLQRMLEKEAPERQEQIFIERLFHGVLEQLLFLDWIISSYSRVKIQKIKPVILHILRMSIFQMLFMDAVPDHAAINEAVLLAKKRGLSGLAPFVNGLLRSFQRGGIKPGMPEHIKKNMPLWLFEKLRRELGKEKADRFFAAAVEPKDYLYARMLLSRAPAETILSMLEKDGCRAEQVPGTIEALRLYQAGNLKELQAFREGLIYIQDLSSMQIARKAAELEKDHSVKKILDVCAAPGGKSLHLAETFPEAEILSRDISEAKIKRIRENAEKYGRPDIRTEVCDARDFDSALKETADIVLADLPCSGIGVIGRKPDIRLRIREEDLDALAALQREILSAVWGYVKKGGLLIYSTCTVNRQENQEQAAWFAESFHFELLYEKQYLPGVEDCDGFYLSCFRKKG